MRDGSRTVSRDHSQTKGSSASLETEVMPSTVLPNPYKRRDRRHLGMHPGDDTRRAPTTRGPAAGLAEERLKSKKMNKSHTWKHPERVAYDADVLKLFWEKKIELHTERLQSEDVRKHRSALDRLRGEWAQKLDDRHRMLQRPPQPSLRGAKSFHTPDKMAA
ncbi:protein FAM240C [Hipposideros larvatus]